MAETVVATPGQKGQGETAPSKPWGVAVGLTVVWAGVCWVLYKILDVPGSVWHQPWPEELGKEGAVSAGMVLAGAFAVLGAVFTFAWVGVRPAQASAFGAWCRDFRKHLAWYQPGQGTNARRAALGLLGLMALYGAFQCYDAFRGHWGWWTGSFWMVPLVDFHATWGMLACAAVFLLLLGAVYLGIVNQPRLATFLIEVEGELKKVSWPAKHEYWGTSVVVLVTVVILGVFLVLADFGSQLLMSVILPSAK